MKHSRDQHQIVYHYADGVADILGLSTAQQLAIRTAMHLALRELMTGYDATVADLTIEVNLLRYELERALPGAAPVDFDKAAMAAVLSPVPAVAAPATIERNGTHSAPAHQVKTPAAQLVSIDSQAAHEAAGGEAQPDPTPAPTKPGANDRKPFPFTWATLDDTTLAIARNLDAGKAAWRFVNVDDKRVIVLAAIAELQMDLAPGKILDIAQFDNRRPIWMASFPSLSTSLGMTWIQMRTAAVHV